MKMHKYSRSVDRYASSQVTSVTLASPLLFTSVAPSSLAFHPPVRKKKSPPLLITIYNSIILPHFLYCNIVWGYS